MGQIIKASDLNINDTIRDPKKKTRIMIVKEINPEIFARGLELGETNIHIFIDKNTFVERVTNATTENSVIN